MSTNQIQSLNRNITNERTALTYPYVKLLDPSDAVALVVPFIEDGTLPIICEFEGIVRQIGSVRLSALVLSKLCKISRLEYHKDKSSCIQINTSEDIMGVLK